MPTIDLDRIAAVRLMNRVDTKFLADERQCMRLLEEAADRYYVQAIGTVRACRYSTLYYDTPQWEMYHLHHNRRLTRQKVRTRTYVETGVSFLEVKNKSNKGRTRKLRMRIGGDIFATAPSDAEAAAFLRQKSSYAPDTLTPSLATRFVRVTLVNRAMTERLTIDFDLHFTNVRAAERMERPAEGMERAAEGIERAAEDTQGAAAEDTQGAAADGFKGAAGGTAALDGLVIIELKQDAMAPSPMKEILARLRIKPFKISKYCIGEALTNPHVKRNRFKAKLRAIDKMSRNANKNITL